MVLKLNDVIEHLDLASNMIGPVGAQSLADGLKNNKGLKVLDLSENEIRAEVDERRWLDAIDTRNCVGQTYHRLVVCERREEAEELVS